MKYVDVNQFAAQDLNLNKLTHINEVLRLPAHRVIITDVRPAFILTGHELYSFTEDGSLTLIETNWDSGD